MSNPLVTIAVVTYNSAKFVIETLESVKAQTWQNIELIVSDDCSADNTVELCSNWIAENKNRFVRTEIITVSVNTGVSANCNRCIAAARSEWVKFIAGDDILLPNCIADNMKFISANATAGIIFSRVLLYSEEFKQDNFIKAVPDQFPMNLMDPVYSAADQYKLLLLSDRITYTPSYFFKKETILSVNRYDETNKLVEDYPMWLKLTRAGNRLYYFDTATVGYRMHQQASNNNITDGLFKPLLLKSAPIKKMYVYPDLPWDIAGSDRHILMVSEFFQRTGMNKKTALFTILYNIGTIYFNPFRYVIFFKKKIMKLGRNNIFYADR